MKVDELQRYRHEQTMWALTAPHMPKGKRAKPPTIPDILKERADG